MNYELEIPIGEKKIRIFLQNGFFALRASVSNYHRHRYPEAHIVISGTVRYEADGVETEVGAGEMYVIPQNVFHRCTAVSEGAERMAFMAESEAHVLGKCVPLPDAVNALAHAVRNENGIDNAKLYSCFAVICSEFIDVPVKAPVPVSDRGFMIHEFFSNNYHSDITVSDIAALLHLSEKQTQRMIKQYTGSDFRTELTRRRMEAARQFMDSSEMSLTEIAEKVGYRSYSGFWKAVKSGGKKN